MEAKIMKPNSSRSLKRTFLSLGLILTIGMLSPNFSNAQVGFAIGPKGGASFNYFKASGNGDYVARTAWAGGLFANLHIGEVFSIQPELLIHQKGATQNVTGTKNEVRLNYFSVPVLFKLSAPIQNTFYPHILAGPVYNYRLNAKYTANESGDVYFNDGDLKRSEIAGAVGAGLDIISNNIFVNLDARYNLGLTDLRDDVVTVRNRNITVMLGVGYRFGTPK